MGCLDIIFVLLFLHAQCSTIIDKTLVDTKVGLIEGLVISNGKHELAMFLGIPYAQVDEENPFGESTAYPKFSEKFEADDDSAICPQSSINGTIIGNIDCLHLNVYVPSSINSNNYVPVMVWIYPGAFMRGFFKKYFYGPTYLVSKGVILVTLNYRVGVYGFMCLDTPEVPGNQGLKDQYLALQWIKENIEAFGGDVNKITLFGQSAGGHSVDLHLISQTDLLFNQVIIQSGSSLAPTVLHEPDSTAPLKMAEYLGFQTRNVKTAIAYLATMNPSSVVLAAIKLEIIFKPCAETEFEDVEPFITTSWLNSKVPKVKNMSVLIGFNEHEMAPAYLNKKGEIFQITSPIYNYLKHVFDFDDELFEEMRKLVSNFYFGDEVMSPDLKWDAINFDSDTSLIHPIQRTIYNYLESGARDIYYYMFSYVSKRNLVFLREGDFNHSSCCASHGDELSFLFDMDFMSTPTGMDEVVMERLTTMWTNFAKFSNPTPTVSDLIPVKWVPLTKDTYTYMNIGYELSLGRRPACNRMAFWQLFYKYNENLQRGYPILQ